AADYRERNAPPGAPAGPSGLRQGMTLFLAAFPDLRITTDDQLADGDKVASRFTTRGTHLGDLFGIPPTGKPVAYPTLDLVRIAGGKIVERWGLDDQLGVMQQLGVLPAPGQAG